VLVVTVWQPTAELGTLAWYGATTNVVNFAELDRAGAYIASRPQASATAEGLARIWRGLRRGKVFPVNPLTGLLGFLGARDHLVPESGLRRLIEKHDGAQPAIAAKPPTIAP
jgi:hypothetical protein